MSEVLEKTNLELYEEQLVQLKDRIRDLDHDAWRALKAIDGKKPADFDFDPERYRTLKAKLQSQLPVLETKMRSERDRVLKQRRAEKERELEDLQPQLNATKAAYDDALKVLQETWEKHAKLEVKAWAIEQNLLTDYEDLRTNQRALESLVREITGVDGPSNTDNLLIRN
jgi:hypothetical protein